MTKTLEKDRDKIQAICDELKKNTLAPAKQEAEKLVKEAEYHAEKIIKEAHARAEEVVKEAHKRVEQEKSVFQSALEQGAKQAMETLRQRIETDLFEPHLHELLQKSMKETKWVAKLIDAMVKAIEKKGVEADLEAVIAENVEAKAVNEELGNKVLEKLKKKSVQIGGFGGGVELKADQKKLTLVMTDEVLKDLLVGYLRKDFRELFFSI